MDQEIKAQWLDALRSGRYQQGDRALRRKDADGTDRFCCLGVLCDVVDPETWELSGDEEEVGIYRYHEADGTSSSGFLPQGVRAAHRIDVDEEMHLIGMNDEGKTFTEIADWIEEHL